MWASLEFFLYPSAMLKVFKVSFFWKVGELLLIWACTPGTNSMCFLSSEMFCIFPSTYVLPQFYGTLAKMCGHVCIIFLLPHMLVMCWCFVYWETMLFLSQSLSLSLSLSLLSLSLSLSWILVTSFIMTLLNHIVGMAGLHL